MTESLSHPLRRWLPLVLLAVAAVAAYVSGLTQYLSLGFLALKLDQLQAFVAAHQFAAVLMYIAAYIITVALSLPGATSLTLLGAVIFGWKIGTPASVIGATLGATIVFAIVKSSLGSSLERKAGPFAEKLAAGFAQNAFSYLLTLRLAPIFPFFIVNIVAAMLRVDLFTFVLATFLGIIPGTLAFNWLGSSVGGMMTSKADAYRHCMASQPAGSCKLDFEVASLLSPQIIGGLFILALVSLFPVVLRRIKGGRHV